MNWYKKWKKKRQLIAVHEHDADWWRDAMRDAHTTEGKEHCMFQMTCELRCIRRLKKL